MTTMNEKNQDPVRISSVQRRNMKPVLWIIGSVMVLVTTFIGLYSFTKPKIGFVRSNDLISKYAGTVESRQIAEKAQGEWKANLDTLQSDYRRAMNTYNENYAALSPAERKDREEQLAHQEQQVVTYARETGVMAEQEGEKLMQGVLNQINTFVIEYGKEHGYDMILGTTAAGSLLYAEDGYDITEEVLAALNAQYKSSGPANAAK